MYLYTEGTWSNISSVLDKMDNDQELYRKLTTLGFRQSQALVYCGGNAQLYTQVAQAGIHSPNVGFEFCCLLYMGKFIYIIGLKSLQDVLHFFQEIGAHPKSTEAITPEHVNNLQLVIAESLSDLATRLEDSSLTVKNLSSIEYTLEHLNMTLLALSKHLSTQKRPRKTNSVSSDQSKLTSQDFLKPKIT